MQSPFVPKSKTKTLNSQTDSRKKDSPVSKMKDYGERKTKNHQALFKMRTNAKNLVKILIHPNDPSSWLAPGSQPHQKC